MADARRPASTRARRPKSAKSAGRALGHLRFWVVLVSFPLVVLDGELAVPSRLWPCPKSALRGVEFPNEGLAGLSLPRPSGVEDRVLRGRSLRTPPGPEGSNGKEILLGAAGAPGWSWLAGVSQADEFDEGCTTIFPVSAI